MRQFIDEVTGNSEDGFDMAASLKDLLGIDENEIDGIIEKLDIDELSNLVDACLKSNKEAAKKIIDSLNIDEKNIPRKKRRNRKEKEHHDTTYGIGDEILVNGKEATIKYPRGPNNTVGVMINGELKMVSKKTDEIKLKETVLGMSPLHGLTTMSQPNEDIRRIRELAGLHDEVPSEMPSQEPMVPPDMEEHPDDRLPFHDMTFGGEQDEGDFDLGDEDFQPEVPEASVPMPMPSEMVPDMPSEGDYASVERAITEIEGMIPNIKISDYKTIVARLKSLVSMVETTGKSALSEAAKRRAKRLGEGFENGAWVEPKNNFDSDPTKAKGSALFSKKSEEVSEDEEVDERAELNPFKAKYVVVGKSSDGKMYKIKQVPKGTDVSDYEGQKRNDTDTLSLMKKDGPEGRYITVKSGVEEDSKEATNKEDSLRRHKKLNSNVLMFKDRMKHANKEPKKEVDEDFGGSMFVAGKSSDGKMYKISIANKNTDLSKYNGRKKSPTDTLSLMRKDGPNGRYVTIKNEVDEDSNSRTRGNDENDAWVNSKAGSNSRTRGNDENDAWVNSKAGVKKEDKVLPKNAPKKEKPHKDEPETGTRKTLMDYVFEADDDGMQTIGADRNSAIQALKMRMGQGVSDQQASAAFDSMVKAGTVKQDGPSYKMPTMSDDALKTSMAPVNQSTNMVNNQNTNMGSQPQRGPIQTIKPA